MPTDFTPEQLAELEKLEQAATKGPWYWESKDHSDSVMGGPPENNRDWLMGNSEDPVIYPWGHDYWGMVIKPTDEQLLVAARNALPQLITMAREALKLQSYNVQAQAEIARRTDRCVAREGAIADLETALKYSSELRIKSAIQFQAQLEGQTREIAELKRNQSIIVGSIENMYDELVSAENAAKELRAKLADQAQLLAEARKQADDLLDELAPHRRVVWLVAKEPTK